MTIYKMNCIRCNNEIECSSYTENVGLIGFKCTCCDENFLVPTNFKNLIKLTKEG